MDRKIKAVIFDWGRTCWNAENKELNEGIEEVLMFIKDKKIPMALTSLVNKKFASEPLEERRERIEKSSIRKCFDVFEIDKGYDKDPILDRATGQLGVAVGDILVVDDRVIRGISWINRRGGVSIWFKNGKFASEEPSDD